MYSVKYADRSFYSQRNNPIDMYNKIIGKSGYLESCMASATVNACVALLDKEPVFKINGKSFQPEQLAWDMLNDRNNWPEMQSLRHLTEEEMLNECIVPSRIPQYIPYIAKHLFGLESKSEYIGIHEMFDLIADNIMNNIASVILLISPAHYVAAVKYDDREDLIICLDSAYDKWRKLTREDFETNVRNYFVEIYPKNI